MVVLTAADWERKATCPGVAAMGEKLALMPCPGKSMPMLLGPSRRMPYWRHNLCN
ncbi:hypothetical protein D3C72_1963670 [compost metagenome]